MLELIYNRTSSDVQYAKDLVNQIKLKGFSSLTEELKELYEKGLKGCYSTPDLNRVENAVQYISDLLNSLDYENKVNTKSWEFGEIFTPEHVERYLQNIRNIRSAITVSSNVPEVPLSYKPYINANKIEEILYRINEIIVNMKQNFIYCGVANCGQSRLWQQRFRRTKDYTSTYPIDKYLSTDTVRLLITSNTTYTGKYTSTLALPQVDIFDDVGGSITAFNTAFTYLDSLIGGVV